MDYREEQRSGHKTIQDYFDRHGREKRHLLKEVCRDYIRFREEVAGFQTRYFQETCTAACYRQERSACCNKDGIITFFADLVINAVFSSPSEFAGLVACLEQPRNDMKCLYLGRNGCSWRIKPIICEMFVCDRAKKAVFGSSPTAEESWGKLERKAAAFRWPDRRKVLFDDIESRFMAAGVSSSLMYLHNSPGLMRVKKKAGLL